MAFVNYNNKEITVKIVYYGPALSGKTTCLKYVYSSKEFEKKGKLITLDTDGDRTLFFDFLPIEVGRLGDYSIKIQLYTVPGQVTYDTTRKLVLQGADGVVFVADSQVIIREQNVESLNNLKDNLELNNISYKEIPIILQYNKRDLKEILPIDDLNKDLNPENKSFFPTVATTGENILEALHSIMKMVMIYLKNKLSIFQKDKTVMFSREEVTATSDHPDDSEMEKEFEEAKVKPKEAEGNEDEVFELSSPIKDEEASKSDSSEHSDEIFNLEDENIMGGYDSDLEVPDVKLKEELSDEKDEDSGKFIAKEVKRTKEDTAKEQTVSIKDFEIPINIDIPDDKDEIKLNLNLRIVVKKK